MTTPFESNSNQTFIIAEAGSNWKAGTMEEDLERSEQLINIASESGADAIKFQTYRSSTVYAPFAGKSDYLSESGFNEDINEIFDYLSMPYELIPKLKKICEEKNIEFMSTPFSIEDAKHIDPFVSIHKIASFEINHIRLLEFLAKTNKPILLSTGASSIDEIDFAVNYLKKNGNSNITLLQCTSKYPAPIESLNLSVIPMLEKRYNMPVGFSDHSLDPIIAPVLAVGYGAKVIEKHFTIDKTFEGPDHGFALEPNELKKMISSIRKAENAKGDGIKQILDDEQELREFATRSIQAIKDIKKGEILQERINFDILRPGKNERGIEPRFLDKVEGKKSTQDISSGSGISEFE